MSIKLQEDAIKAIQNLETKWKYDGLIVSYNKREFTFIWMSNLLKWEYKLHIYLSNEGEIMFSSFTVAKDLNGTRAIPEPIRLDWMPTLLEYAPRLFCLWRKNEPTQMSSTKLPK